MSDPYSLGVLLSRDVPQRKSRVKPMQAHTAQQTERLLCSVANEW